MRHTLTSRKKGGFSMKEATMIVQPNISSQNNKLNELAARLVARAVRLHNTIYIGSLTLEELHAQDN
jgi:hypothetical protein